MTPTEAAALALIGLHNRRLLAALLRVLTERGTAEDHEALCARERDEPLVQWACRCGPSPRAADGPLAEAARIEREAAAQLNQASRLGVTAVPLSDPRYPRLLASIPDPPPLLWVRGDPAVLSETAIGIVGSRAATPYGLAMSKRLAGELAAVGIVIVSGLARGIDSSAHLAAVLAGGRTVGVLGCGIDRIYPAEHGELAREMAHAGAVISEFPPGVPPLPHHFPLRNRIISGLSVAVVVVEAPEKSGALITASAALEQGRDVMVVPGPTTGGRNRGGHLLIRDGGKLVETTDDILQDLGVLSCRLAGGPAQLDMGQLPESTDFTVDEVAAWTGELPNVVLARLMELELAGRIQRVGGGRFARVTVLP